MLHKPCRTRERAFFPFPEDEQQRKTLLRFLNRSDAQEFKHVLVFAKHFSDHVINKNEKRFLVYQEIKTCSINRFSFSNVSDEVLETIIVQ